MLASKGESAYILPMSSKSAWLCNSRQFQAAVGQRESLGIFRFSQVEGPSACHMKRDKTAPWSFVPPELFHKHFELL